MKIYYLVTGNKENSIRLVQQSLYSYIDPSIRYHLNKKNKCGWMKDVN